MASCRKPEPAPRQGGFTLVEILVVLAILAGVAAIAYPSLVTLYARMRAALDQQDLEEQLFALPQRVRVSGHAGLLARTEADATSPAAAGDPSFALEQPQPLQLDLPSGWRIEVPKTVHYHATGACDGGEVSFSLPPVSLRYLLSPPLCLPKLAHDR